jgi:hypothetical protein
MKIARHHLRQSAHREFRRLAALVAGLAERTQSDLSSTFSRMGDFFDVRSECPFQCERLTRQAGLLNGILRFAQ